MCLAGLLFLTVASSDSQAGVLLMPLQSTDWPGKADVWALEQKHLGCQTKLCCTLMGPAWEVKLEAALA